MDRRVGEQGCGSLGGIARTMLFHEMAAWAEKVCKPTDLLSLIGSKFVGIGGRFGGPDVVKVPASG